MALTKTAKIWITILAIPLFLVVAAILAAKIYFTSDKLKALVVPKLEASTHRNVSVREISFSVFPPLVLSLENFRLSNPQGSSFGRDEFVSLDELRLKVNLFAMLGNKVDIDYIILDRPQIYLEVNEQGAKNFSMKEPGKVPENAPGAGGASGQLLLSNLEINDGIIEFVNKKLDSRFELRGVNQVMSVRSAAGNQKLLIEGNTTIDTLRYGTTKSWYLSVYPTTADLHLSYGIPEDILTFDNVSAKLRDLPMKIEGSISKLRQETNYYDLTITSPGVQMDQLLSLVPQEMLKKTKGLTSSGDVQLSIVYKGSSNDVVSPGVNGKFSVTGGKVQYASMPKSISNINVAGNFEIPEAPIEKKDIGTLNVEKFSATIGRSDVNGSLGVTNFDNPYTKAKIDGTVDLNEVKEYYPLDPGSEFAGMMKANVALEGKAKAPESMKANGTVAFENVTLKSAGSRKPVRDLNGVVSFNNQVIESKKTSLKIGESDLDVAFSLKNYMGMGMVMDKKSAARPSATVVLKSKQLRTADLMSEEPAEKGEAKGGTAAAKQGTVLPDIDMDAQVSIDKLVTEKFAFENARGTAKVSKGIIDVKNMTLNAFNGTVQSNGTIDLHDPKRSPFDLDLNVKGVESNALLSNFTSFGKYLFGKFSTTTKIKGDLNDTMGLDAKTLFGSGIVDISDGKLLGFPLTQKLAEVTSISELREVNFKDWTNAFSISNGRINVKGLKVHSGATDFLMEGSQGLDGTMDYLLTVKLPSSLSDKAKLGGLAGQVIDNLKDKDGRLNLTFDVGGTNSNPAIKLNENAAKAALEQKGNEAKKKLEDDLKKKAEEGIKKLFKRP